MKAWTSLTDTPVVKTYREALSRWLKSGAAQLGLEPPL
jgi:hypothetical protein